MADNSPLLSGQLLAVDKQRRSSTDRRCSRKQGTDTDIDSLQGTLRGTAWAVVALLVGPRARRALAVPWAGKQLQRVWEQQWVDNDRSCAS